MNSSVEQRPLGQLFSELASETGILVRKEVELATVEMTGKAKAAGKGVALAAVGGALAWLAILALMAAIIVALADVMPLWASALVVGGIVGLVGGVLLAAGISAVKRIEAAPQETIQTLKEDRQWLERQMSR